MSGIAETRTYDALLTTTLANYREKLEDNIFDNYPLLSYMNGRLGEAMRGNSVKRVEDGGESIREQLLYGMNSTANSYSGYGILDTTPQEGLTIARYNWKQYDVSITISGLEERSNSGESRILNLLESKTRQAEMSLKDRLSRNAFGDGTGNAGLDLTGLAALVSASSTLGGLAPGTYDWWKSTVTSGGSFAAQGLADMRTTFNTLSQGNDRPDFIVTDQATYEYYETALQPQERYNDTRVANSGFTSLTFKGVPVLFDRDCTAGYIYMLNSQYLNYVVHGQADLAIQPFIKPTNQDAKTAHILLQANMTTGNRRKLGVITGVTA